MRPMAWVIGWIGCVLFVGSVWGCEGISPKTEEKAATESQSTEQREEYAQDGEVDAGTEERVMVETVSETSEAIKEAMAEGVSESDPPEKIAEKVPEQPLDGPSETWKDAVIHQGKATYYDADGSGNCSFPSVSVPLVAAMNEQEYGMADYCGACVKVDGPKGSVLVRITDRCPECSKGHLDLSREAFAKIGDPVQGVIAITWQVVSCPEVGPIQYHYKDGSSQWWTAIQVRNHRLPLKQVELFKNNQWQSLPRERYNYFLDAKGAGTQPLRLRLTATNGQSIEETIPPPASDLLVTGKQQFVP
ncbi:hypothetical protein L6R29_16875 [Myxococcota bacterium]|nr:hypothetical protein [Myxococcota bacterium]